MTKKQYQRKVMQLLRNMKADVEKKGIKTKMMTDRVNTPNWGNEIPTGKYKGQKLTSYEQCWDMLCEVLKGTPAMNDLC